MVQDYVISGRWVGTRPRLWSSYSLHEGTNECKTLNVSKRHKYPCYSYISVNQGTNQTFKNGQIRQTHSRCRSLPPTQPGSSHKSKRGFIQNLSCLWRRRTMKSWFGRERKAQKWILLTPSQSRCR